MTKAEFYFLSYVFEVMSETDRLFISDKELYTLVPEGTLVRGPGIYLTKGEVLRKMTIAVLEEGDKWFID